MSPSAQSPDRFNPYLRAFFCVHTAQLDPNLNATQQEMVAEWVKLARLEASKLGRDYNTDVKQPDAMVRQIVAAGIPMKEITELIIGIKLPWIVAPKIMAAFNADLDAKGAGFVTPQHVEAHPLPLGPIEELLSATA